MTYTHAYTTPSRPHDTHNKPTIRDNRPSFFGWTPLHHAAFFGHAPVACELLMHGAEMNAQNPIGLTPIGSAMFNGRKDTATVCLLVASRRCHRLTAC